MGKQGSPASNVLEPFVPHAVRSYKAADQMLMESRFKASKADMRRYHHATCGTGSF